MSVAVVIPCYRVRLQILPLIEQIGAEVNWIIVIDDACPEESGRYPSSRILRSRSRPALVRQESPSYRFNIMLSLSGKMSSTVARSWSLGGVPGLHWSNRKRALTANSSSRSSLSSSSTKSIRCIFPAMYPQTSKTVADMPGVS
jgi:hypothetical protein